MRGDKSGFRRNNRRMARSKDQGSDESDEDYMVGEEELDETEDEYCLTFDEDESEEILGELEEEKDEEEEFVCKKVKKFGRPKVKMADGVRGRKKVGHVKPKRKKRPLYSEEEEDDNDDVDDVDYDYDDDKTNEVAKPRKKMISYREEEDDDGGDGDGDGDDVDDADYDYDDEKTHEVAKQRKKKRISYREEEEEDDDDDDEDDDVDYDYDDEKTNEVAKPRKKKRISYREEDDGYDSADYDCGDQKINEVAKPRKNKRASYKEEEDDDYSDGDDKFDGESVNIGLRLRERKRSYIEDDDNDDYDVLDDKVDDEKKRKVAKRKQKRVSYREEDDDDDVDADDHSSGDEFDDEKANKVMKPREKRRAYYKEEDDDYDVVEDRFLDEKVSEVAKPRMKNEVSYREGDGDYDCTDDGDEDYDGTDDDDDDEFIPDEIDGLDVEDELLVMNNNKKVGRPRMQEKVITRGRKRKSSSKVLKKTARNKPRKNCQPNMKEKSKSDGEFIDTKPIVEKNKKVNARGRRGRTVNSDSDFVSSGSSDYEYTISEEEQELIQEVNEFCRSSTTNLRSSTSLKKPEEEKEMLTQRKRPARKGKEKAEDLKVEVGKPVCGICLTEEGKRTIRGTLDCCNHYFCFACIMEWSKVESRCPLCKQRFVTISKPARLGTGFDLRTVVIQVPERDQVYQPSEEELQGLLNPYDSVLCTECNEGGDDALMLLCDLCDSPAHTYCVGLGCEVPEGNWYCEGCKPTAPGSSNPQVLTPTTDLKTNGDLSSRSPPASNIRETFDLNEMYVPDTPLTQETSQLPSPRPSVGDVQLPSPVSGSGAYTLLERRRIQYQIHQLINNRRRQTDDRSLETPTTVSGHSLFGSQVGRSRELVTQPLVTPERMSSNNICFQGNFQDNTMSLLQSYDAPSPGLTHIRGQLSQNQPSTSTSRSFSGYIQNEFARFNSSSGFRSSHQPLQPCSGRSNSVSDGSRPSCPFGEATVPSRTFQEALHSQF